MKQTDYLVIGTGIAGLSTALNLAEFGEVLMLTKGKLKNSNTYWAQGGIACVMAKEDSFKSHIEDTIRAGANVNDHAAVRFLVENGPNAIRWLKEIGVKFNESPALEAGHTVARIWRTSDFTGQDVLDVLLKKAKKTNNINFQEESDAVQLIVHQGTCRGAFVMVGDEITPILAKHVIIATGGLGQLFLKTTNSLGAAGDGLALADKAGVKLKDLEFIQFHPTAFDEPSKGRYFLLSEALRGFGAKILNSKEEPFLEKVHQDAELAPRDVVTRAIYFEQINGPVYLTLRHKDAKSVYKRFPNIAKRLKKHKYDLAKDLIPVTPVAHFSCGGIPTDLKGATTLPGLFAVGEVARTGVHGANRLASNALLEAVVFGQAIAKACERSLPIDKATVMPESIKIETPNIITEDEAQLKGYSARIRKAMWEYVGIIRTPSGLEQANKVIHEIPARDYRIQNRQQVCYNIIKACLSRSESLGTHFITSELS